MTKHKTFRAMLETEPRAVSAKYNRQTGRVTVELANGCTYMFPTVLVQDLAEASPEDLETIQADGVGFNLYWPKPDADLYVPALWKKAPVAQECPLHSSSGD